MKIISNNFLLIIMSLLLPYSFNMYCAANIKSSLYHNDPCQSSFYDAILNGDLNSAKSLINKLININWCIGHEGPFVMIAIRNNQKDIAKLIIEDPSFDPNQHDPRSNTPLMSAATRNYVDLVRLLVEKGAKINIIGEHGTALRRAAYFGANIDICKLLLYVGADFDNTYAGKKIIEELFIHLENINLEYDTRSRCLDIIKLLIKESSRRDNGRIAYLTDQISSRITIFPNVISKIIGDYAVEKYSLPYTSIPLIDLLKMHDNETNNDNKKPTTES